MFKARTNPFQHLSSYQNLERDGGLDWSSEDSTMRSLDTLRTPSVRDEIVGEALSLMQSGERQGLMFKGMIGPMGQTYHWCENYEPDISESVKATAEREGKEEVEVLYDMMCHASDGSPGAGCLWRPIFANRMDGSYDPSLQGVHDTFMNYDHAVPGVADAGAHGTILTDAVSNTSFLAHYVRDREAQMPIELAVMKSSLAAAQIYGLDDRGVLLPGKKADSECSSFLPFVSPSEPQQKPPWLRSQRLPAGQAQGAPAAVRQRPAEGCAALDPGCAALSCATAAARPAS